MSDEYAKVQYTELYNRCESRVEVKSFASLFKGCGIPQAAQKIPLQDPIRRGPSAFAAGAANNATGVPVNP